MRIRRVKCVDTGEYSTNNVAFKAPNNKYYSSEAAWNIIRQKQDERQACINAFVEVTDYKPYYSNPTPFYEKLKLWGDVYGYKVVLAAIHGEAKNIRWAMQNKNFDNKYREVQYITAIIANNINKYARLLKDEESMRRRNEVSVIEDTFCEKMIDVKRENTGDVSELLGDI